MATTYNPNYFVRFHTIGGQGGSDFAWVHGTNGNLIKKLEVWVGPSQIRGIRVTLFNNESQTFGKLEDKNAGSLELEPGERITSLSIWGNGAGTRCGAFKIVTSKGKTFFPKMYSWGLKTEYSMDVGSGLLAGIYGRGNADIDALGFAHLLPIKNSILKGITYPTLDSDLVATTPFMLDRVTIDNLQGTVPKEATLRGSESLTTETSWSNTTSLELSITSTVKAGIPLIADVEVSTSITVGNEFTYQRTTSSTVERSVENKVIAPPGQKVRDTATTYQDKLDLPYYGTFEVQMQNGTIFSYPVSGIYKGVSARSVFITTEVLETARAFVSERANSEVRANIEVIDEELEGTSLPLNEALNENLIVKMF